MEELEIVRLEGLVTEAISVLANNFKVNRKDLGLLEKPSVIIELNENYYYHPWLNKIKLGIKDFDQTSIGEEVGHWFHYKLNKSLNDSSRGYSKIRVVELVGAYSRLVYASEVLRKNAVPDVKESIKTLGYNDEPTQHGYKVAIQLFSKFGDFYLSKIARMSLEEADKFLDSFGYWKSC